MSPAISFHRDHSLRDATQNSFCASARPLDLESGQLLTQGTVFEDEILAGAKGAAKPAENVPEPHDHGKNLIPAGETNLVPTY